MVWKEPELSELHVSKEIANIISTSIYYNSDGYLVNASLLMKIEYFVASILIWLISNSIIYFSLSYFFQNILGISIFILIISFVAIFYGLYRWGWKNYKEAWYKFDHDDEVMTVVRKHHGEWEIFDLPYEEIHEIEYVDGPNGFAAIKVASFEFHTNRSSDKRRSSVTEIWNDLARINTEMSSWPIDLICPSCKKQFGNHTGTAICPFDQVILIDPEVKGRIDPITQHKDDIDRL